MAAAELWGPSLTGEGEAEELAGMRATTALFDVFGVRAALGRTFDRRRTRRCPKGRGDRRRFMEAALRRRSGNRGTARAVESRIYLVAGVLPKGFYFPPFWGARTEIYTPLMFPPAKAQDRQAARCGFLRGWPRERLGTRRAPRSAGSRDAWPRNIPRATRKRTRWRFRWRRSPPAKCARHWWCCWGGGCDSVDRVRESGEPVAGAGQRPA